VTDQTWPPRGDRVLNSWKCARHGPTVEAVTPLQHTAAPFLGWETGQLWRLRRVLKPALLVVVGRVSHAELGQAAADDVGDHGEGREAPTVLAGEAVGVKVRGE
jgi:hypothetical protein